MQAEGGIRVAQESRGLGDVYRSQATDVGLSTKGLRTCYVTLALWLVLRASRPATAGVLTFASEGFPSRPLQHVLSQDPIQHVIIIN